MYWLSQWPPTFMAPGNDFMEDSFSRDEGGGMDGSGGNASNGEQWPGPDEKSPSLLAHSPSAHLLLCGRVLNRPQGAGNPWVKQPDSGPHCL